MKLLILGTGCAKCTKLQELTTQAAREIGLTCEIKKISDLKTIMQFGAMTTPALVVNNALKVAGKVPRWRNSQPFSGNRIWKQQ